MIDFTIYEKRLIGLPKLYQIPKKLYAGILLSKLKNEDYKRVHDLLLPLEITSADYETLSTILKNFYLSHTTVYAERRAFYSTEMQEADTVYEWYTKIREVASNCKFGAHLEFAVKEKFICGMFAGPILDRLLEEDEDLTLERALKIAQRKEVIVKTKRSQQVHYIQNKPRKKFNDQRQQNPPKTCKVCGKLGHCETKCGYRNWNCDVCDEKGHLKAVCPRKNQRGKKA
jgi:hypothetical protein